MKALMKLIYHIARRADWESARTSGLYTADSLATEGFIHCSTARQVLATAQRIFAGRTDLVLIAIDSARGKGTRITVSFPPARTRPAPGVIAR